MKQEPIRAIIVDDEAIARSILETHLASIEEVDLVASCKSAMEAFKLIHQEDIDLIFLDIQMPEITGLSFAKSIPEGISVIFTTAHREFALEGFELDAVDYLLKPISPDRLQKALQKLTRTKLEQSASEQESAKPLPYFFVKSDRKMVKVNFADILYVESLADYVKIHTLSGMVLSRETLTAMETKLPSEQFLRCHRSFIVSLEHLKAFNHEQIEIGSSWVPISRNYRKEVLKRLA